MLTWEELLCDTPRSWAADTPSLSHVYHVLRLMMAGTPVMVVSDLDGTMVGDDAATAAFRNWVSGCLAEPCLCTTIYAVTLCFRQDS